MTTEIRLTIQAVPGKELTDSDVESWINDLNKLVRMARTADANLDQDRLATTQVVVLNGQSITYSREAWI